MVLKRGPGEKVEPLGSGGAAIMDLLLPRLHGVFDKEIFRLGIKGDGNRIILFGEEECEVVAYVRYSLPVCRVSHAALEAAFRDDKWDKIDGLILKAAELVGQELSRTATLIE